MKRIVSVLLVIAMTLSFAACGEKKNSATATAVLPDPQFDTLNKIVNGGFEVVGTGIYDSLYIQTVVNKPGTEFVVIVKVPEEQREALDSIDFLSDDSREQYLALIGDNELTDVMNTDDFLPDRQILDSYKGMTIAEFEQALGAYMTGYIGDNGKYACFLSDDMYEYRFGLEKGIKFDDTGDIDQFDAAVQDKKISSVDECHLTSVFLDGYYQNFLDAPEKAVPQEMGEAKASLDEINKAVGSSIKAIAGATEEKFSVIDGKIAQYIYKLNDTYFCIRSAADLSIDLADDDFDEDPIRDKDGYYTTSYSQSDKTNSVRFAFNEYQYALIAYDNGEFDYQQFDNYYEEFSGAICEYPQNSIFVKILGMHSSDDGYSMSIIPVSNDSAQVAIYVYDQQTSETRLWTMVTKLSSGKLTYDKSKYEVYKDGGETVSEGGKGTITINGDTIIWNKHSFK